MAIRARISKTGKTKVEKTSGTKAKTAANQKRAPTQFYRETGSETQRPLVQTARMQAERARSRILQQSKRRPRK